MVASKDSLISWDEAFSLGLPEIDDQHQSLFEIMNRLWSAIVTRGDGARMLAILGELEHYTQTHFTAEETFMRVIHYPDFNAHKTAHTSFIQRLAAERQALETGRPLSLDLLHFLKDWLVNHIQVMDRAYSEVHKASQQPQQPQSFLGKFFQRFF